MKYLYLPAHLIGFWYWEAARAFFRVWINSISFLEEDLAVGLMWKLLFIPLFHDTSIVGRALSFNFRLFRIATGLFAFVLGTSLVAVVAAFWFAVPYLSTKAGILGMISQFFVFSGVVLFVYHVMAHPHKKVSQLKDAGELWRASFLPKSQIQLNKLLKRTEIRDFLLYLERIPEDFRDFNTVDFPRVESKVWELGKKIQVPYFTAEYFFAAMVLTAPDGAKKLLKLGLKEGDFLDALDFLAGKTREWRLVWPWDEDFRTRHLRGTNRGWLGVPTPNLDLVAEDLTRKASREYIPDFVGRAEIVKRVSDVLSSDKSSNLLLVGEAGTGKSEMIDYLAKLIVLGDAPPSLATRRLVRLDLSRLLSGVTTQGELAERVKNIFEEVRFSGGVIIFVDEIHALGTGEAGSEFNLYSLMLPYLESNDFQFIGSTEPAGFNKVVGKNSSFVRLFTKIDLDPATVEDTVKILKNQAINTERYEHLKISIPALKEIAALSEKYIHNRVLPDSALHIFDECLVRTKNQWVTKAVVEAVFQSQTNLPVGEAGKEVKLQLLNLERLIHEQMIDQEEAVTAVASTLRRAAAQLRDQQRPIGSFLFVGPTGVGKTELAKILVEKYFKGKGNFLRLDMSEYQTPESVNRLIGAAGEEGRITSEVRDKPYSLILLDEFEKADPKVLTIFLQVLDDGRLTDGTGRTVDFTQCIIIATSNAASLTIASGLRSGKTIEEIKKPVNDELLMIFKPELINRFDEVVVFKTLSSEDLQKIVRLKLSLLRKQLEDQGYIVDFEDNLVNGLVKKGYDPVLGARPLRRLIQDTLEARLSTLILEGKLPKGEKFLAASQLLG